MSLILAGAAIALVRDTYYNAWDFDVFWRAGRALLEGRSIYGLRGDGMVFKYPPWTAPFFIPWAMLPIQWARGAWGVTEVLSLAAVVHWLRRRAGCDGRVALGVLAAFWGIWVVHALDGQISLTLLAVALWAGTVGRAIGLSTKIFTLWSLLGSVQNPRFWSQLKKVAVISMVLSLPAMWSDRAQGLTGMWKAWAVAAASGGSSLNPGQVRGLRNAGLPAFVLRVLEIPGGDSRADIIAFILIGSIVALIWWRWSRHIAEPSRWAGWLGLAPIVHPLPWWHLFVFSFPLAAMSLQAGLRSSRPRLWAGLALLGIFLIAIATEKSLGLPGRALEWASAKSWGALLCAWVLARAV